MSDARERLVQASIDLLWQQSYGAVSVDDICERARVKKGSFYHFFSSKDELVLAALESHWAARKPSLDEAFSPTVAPLDRFRRYFEGVYQRQRAHRERSGIVPGCFYQNLGQACIAQHPAIAAKGQEILATYRKYYESAIRDAQAAGVLKVKDPVETAVSLFAYMEGVLAQARVANDLTAVKNLGRTALEWLGLSLTPETPAGKPRRGSRHADVT